MLPHRRLAAAQTVPVRGDVAANTAQHLTLIGAAADANAHVVVFPELSLTGYELDLAPALAFTERDPRLDPLTDAAAARGITVVVGAPVAIGGRLHIGAFILSPDRTVAVYTKHHLGAFVETAAAGGVVPPAERSVFLPGDRSPMVVCDGGPAAVAICADTGHPSHAHTAAVRGARVYLASMFVIPSEFDREAGVLPTYAARHGMAVVFANYGGPSGRLAAAGRSAVWSDTGERVVQLPESGTGLAVAIEDDGGWRGSIAVPAGGKGGTS